MYLFFDTETTGLPKNFKAPVSDIDNWPRLVQLSWAWFDNEGKAWDRYDYIIKPEGFVIPEESTKIHRISHQQALAEGKDLQLVLNEFAEHIARADALVGHNIDFDDKIIGSEFYRNKIDNNLVMVKKICTMKSSVDICRISNGRGGYKWPNLAELHQYLFKKNFEDAHNAMVDVLACARCFYEIRRQGYNI
ncbi:MAG: 3'-5' exonuclease [Patescibacteria group bacterium]|nr:3'-5' exonuclease [Patescibacteria group bacterium]